MPIVDYVGTPVITPPEMLHVPRRATPQRGGRTWLVGIGHRPSCVVAMVLLLEPSNVGPMGGAARASPMASPRLAARCARRLRGAHRSEEAADRGPPRSSPLPRSRERAEAMAEALPLPGTEPCRATNGAREAEANCIEIGASRCTRA